MIFFETLPERNCFTGSTQIRTGVINFTHRLWTGKTGFIERCKAFSSKNIVRTGKSAPDYLSGITHVKIAISNSYILSVT
jgi:hypothetical protein